MNKIDNPFVEYGYAEPAYFCDREQETHAGYIVYDRFLAIWLRNYL